MVSLFKEIIHQLRAGGVERITDKDGEHVGHIEGLSTYRQLIIEEKSSVNKDIIKLGNFQKSYENFIENAKKIDRDCAKIISSAGYNYRKETGLAKEEWKKIGKVLIGTLVIAGTIGGVPAAGGSAKEALKYLGKMSLIDATTEGIAGGVVGYYNEGVNGAFGGVKAGIVSGLITGGIGGATSLKGIKVPKKINIKETIKNLKFLNKVKNMKLPVGFKYKEVYGLQYAGVPGSSNGIKAPVGLEFKKVDDIISYVKANKLSDVDKSITNGAVKAEGKIKVPTVKSGEFNDWFNSLSVDELDSMWQNKSTRRAIERQLRAPGGMHEWHLVSRAPQFKNWGVNAEQIRDLRTAISDVEFINPVGKHGQLGSTTAHNELLGIIDSSIDYDMFSRRLNNWANYRPKGGVDALPEGLKLK